MIARLPDACACCPAPGWWRLNGVGDLAGPIDIVEPERIAPVGVMAIELKAISGLLLPERPNARTCPKTPVALVNDPVAVNARRK